MLQVTEKYIILIIAYTIYVFVHAREFAGVLSFFRSQVKRKTLFTVDVSVLTVLICQRIQF